MERKLELRDIAGYLPYGLRCEIDKSFYDFDLEMANNWFGYYDKVNIFLRPLSNLYRTITHNRKEIVPIMELAKIARPDFDWVFKQEYCAYSKSQKTNFSFMNGFFSIVTDEMNCYYVMNEYLLFDYLHELKIDYRGLIDAGLAVNVYDLEDNPYK